MLGTVLAVPVGRIDAVRVRRCVSCGRLLNSPRSETSECGDCSRATVAARRRGISLTIEEIRSLLGGGDGDDTTVGATRVRRSHAASARPARRTAD